MNTKTFRFLGNKADIKGLRPLTEFGQKVELPPESAADTVRQGGPLCIPAEDWDRLNGDPQSCRQFLHDARQAGAFPTAAAKKETK